MASMNVAVVYSYQQV